MGAEISQAGMDCIQSWFIPPFQGWESSYLNFRVTSTIAPSRDGNENPAGSSLIFSWRNTATNGSSFWVYVFKAIPEDL